MNTLQMYKTLIAGGVSPSEAEAQVYSLEVALDNVATKADLTTLEAHIKQYMIYVNAGTVTVGILLPIFLKLIGVL